MGKSGSGPNPIPGPFDPDPDFDFDNDRTDRTDCREATLEGARGIGRPPAILHSLICDHAGPQDLRLFIDRSKPTSYEGYRNGRCLVDQPGGNMI
ncbi:MAG: hypothetical protein ACOX52_05180 [Verrucomicrobiota bacterium]